MRRREFILALGSNAVCAAMKTGGLEEAASMVQQTVAAGKIRAAALYVSTPGGAFQRGFGAAKTPDAIFLIASITKPMTAAGVMKLVDAGELRIDDPIRKFIPEFSEGDRSLITIRHALTHTSGLPDQLPENVELRQRHAPLSEFVKHSIRTPLLFKPGARHKYQSMGILLAAEVAQRITRKPFPEFLDEAVFRPLGMTRTALGLGRFKIPETMQCQVTEAPGMYGGGSSDARSWHWNSPYWRNLAAPWGGAHSTGPDIAKFLGYFLKPHAGFLKPQTAASMIVNQAGNVDHPWGIGFAMKPGSFGRGCSSKTFGHSGATGTLAWADPATGRVFVLLTTLPAEQSRPLVINPVSDKVSEASVEAKRTGI